jgi:hypothetical protein
MIPQPIRTGSTFSAAITGTARQQTTATAIERKHFFIIRIPVH